MDSFAKYAEESMKKINVEKDVFQGGSGNGAKTTAVQDAFLNSLFKPSIDGGLDTSGPIPELENSDFTVASMYWSNGEYWGLLSGLVKFFMAMSLYLVLYWLFAPGQMLQLYNSRSFCNSQVYGKDNTSDVETQYNVCKGLLMQPFTGDKDLPSGAYSGSWTEYNNCYNLVKCSKRAQWGSYFISFPSILFHGILLGVVLSLLPMLKDSLTFLSIDYYLKMTTDLVTYMLGWAFYLSVGLPLSLFYGMDYGYTFMPNYDMISSY
jgi:hypothetical protein